MPRHVRLDNDKGVSGACRWSVCRLGTSVCVPTVAVGPTSVCMEAHSVPDQHAVTDLPSEGAQYGHAAFGGNRQFMMTSDDANQSTWINLGRPYRTQCQ